MIRFKADTQTYSVRIHVKCSDIGSVGGIRIQGPPQQQSATCPGDLQAGCPGRGDSASGTAHINDIRLRGLVKGVLERWWLNYKS